MNVVKKNTLTCKYLLKYMNKKPTTKNVKSIVSIIYHCIRKSILSEDGMSV